MNPFITNLDDYPHTRVIPLRRIFIILTSIIVLLTISCVLVCATNDQCKRTVPTLNNLLNTILVAPYVLTEINIIFWLHIFISACLFYLTSEDAPKWSKVQFTASICLYASIVVTLFVLPFTAWDNDYANYLIVVSIMVWMIAVTVSLRYRYIHAKGKKQWWLLWNTTTCVVYILASLVYIILRTFFSAELSGILAVEIASGLSFIIFLVVCIVHIWHMEFQIKI